MPLLSPAPCGAVFVALLAATAAAQRADWEQVPVQYGPALRIGPAVADVFQGNAILLFGGHTGSPTGPAALDDTWRWDGGRWQELQPAQRPSPRGKAALTELPGTTELLLFGGQPAPRSGWLADTWTWDGAQWTQVHPARVPPPLEFPRLVADHARGRTFLLGRLQGVLQGWEWLAGSWTRWRPDPLPRSLHQVAWSPGDGRIVLLTLPTAPLGISTWTWDGTRWTDHGPADPALLSYEIDLAADSRFGATIAVTRPHPTAAAVTMIWTGAAWRTLPVVHGLGTYGAATMRHEPTSGEVWLRPDGGAQGHYRLHLRGGTDAAVIPYGAGCAGSGGTPSLGATGGAVPVLGTTLPLEVLGLPATRLAVPWGLLGVSDRVHHLGGALPLDLGPAGMPGCSLYTSGDADLRLQNTVGRAAWELSIPDVLALDGAEVHAQVIVLDAAANALGMTVSNAARLRLGTQ